MSMARGRPIFAAIIAAMLIASTIAFAAMALSPTGSCAATYSGPSPSVARIRVVVLLHPVAGGRVHGRAMLTAAGGGTRVVLDIRGLPPGARAGARIHYGVCSNLAHVSASFASLPNLRADRRGRARATGRVVTALQRQNVRLSDLADGHHAIVVDLLRGGIVACGTIP